MDQRQTQIREGAGLEESRLNVEFIELLRTWSSPVLLLAAVLAFGYWGWQKWQESRVNRLNAAFSEFDAAAGGNDPSPDSLRAVASEYGDVRAVGLMAKLQAADVYLRAVRLGLKVGAQLEAGEDGQASYKPEDILEDADRARYLDNAASLYNEVIAGAQGKPGMNVLHEINGLYGLAAVEESRGNMDQAKAAYERVIAAAKRAGFDAHVKVAQGRIDALPSLANLPKIYHAADLPKALAPPAPEPAVEPAPQDEPRAAPAGGEEGADNPEGGGDQPAEDVPTEPAPEQPDQPQEPDQPK